MTSLAEKLCPCGSGLEPKYLCDYQYAHLDGFYRLKDGVSKTCDKPLCDKCRVHQGTMFASGKEHFIESFDYCKHHDARRKFELEHKVKPETKNILMERIK